MLHKFNRLYSTDDDPIRSKRVSRLSQPYFLKLNFQISIAFVIFLFFKVKFPKFQLKCKRVKLSRIINDFVKEYLSRNILFQYNYLNAANRIIHNR